jgi:hypothetical protein
MRKRGIFAAIALACATLGAVDTASASRIGYTFWGDESGYELTYEADPGESNLVTHKATGGSAYNARYVTITDTGATIQTAPPCWSSGPHVATCPALSPIHEGPAFGGEVLQCLQANPLAPQDCDADIGNSGFFYLRFMLSDGTNRYESTPGTVPLHVTVVGADGYGTHTDGENVFSVRGEGSASLNGGDGPDRVSVGRLVQPVPFSGWASVHGGGGDDRIDVRNGHAGDGFLCGSGDDVSRADAGDSAGQGHECERIDAGVIAEP